MSLLRNASMEHDGDWTLTGGAAYSTAQNVDGSRSLMLDWTAGNIGEGSIADQSDVLVPLSGQHVFLPYVRFEEIANGGTAVYTLFLEHFNGTDWDIVWQLDGASLPAGAWSRPAVAAFPLTAGEAERFRIRADTVGEMGDRGRWYVDVAVLEEDIPTGITSRIREALILDLGTINGLPPFRSKVNLVSEEPDQLPNVEDAAVYLFTSDGGISDDAERTIDEVGLAVQSFWMKAYRRTARPNRDVERLLDDIRLACERSGSNLMRVEGQVGGALMPVEFVTVADWGDISRTSDDLHGGDWGIIGRIIVEIRYHYSREVV